MNCNTIFITEVSATATEIILVPNRTVKLENLGNRCKYNLIIACGLRVESSLPVFIKTDSGNVPLLDKYSNTVFANQLSTRTNYCTYYGNNNTNYTLGQLTIKNNLCHSLNTAVAPTQAKLNVDKAEKTKERHVL